MAKLITLGSLIDTSIHHYTKNFKELVGISLWLVIGTAPFLFSQFLAPFGVDTATPTGELLAYLGLNLTGFLTTTLTSLWVGITLIYTIHARAQSTTPNHITLGKRAWKSMPSFIVLSLALGLGFTLAALATFIPGLLILLTNSASGTAGTLLGVLGTLLLLGGIVAAIYILVRFGIELVFTQYTLLLENDATSFSWKTLRRAVTASRQAVRGQWFAVALRIFIPNAIFSLVIYGVTIGLNIITTLFVSLASGWLSSFAIQLISVLFTVSVTIISALALPLYSLATYYTYDSARTK